MTHQPPQLPPDGALIRRMDAYLSGESAEATAIIKDARAALSSQAPADRPTDEQIEDACFAATGCRDRDVCAGFDEGVKWALQSRQPAAPVAPVAVVLASPTPPVQPDVRKMLEDLEDAAEQWAAYVEVDTAPCTLARYLEPHFENIRAALAAAQAEGGRK